jgi:hypothetical protein
MSDPVNTTAPVAAQATPATSAPAPDLSNMTGAEAVAYVEAQKAAKNQPVAQKAASAPEPESIKDIVKEAARKYKVKVDGSEREVEESELIRGYAHQQAANKILQEGKGARKQAEDFIAMMKDPQKFYEAAQKMGHNPRELAEKYLASQLEDELMDPREKELKDAKSKLAKYDEIEKEQLRQAEQKRSDELRDKYSKEYEAQFVEALKETQLPPTKPMVAEMAKYISRSAKIGFKMTPNEAAQLVKEDIQRAQVALFQSSDGDTLLRLLGDETANKILQARGSKVKSPEANLRTPETQGEPSERNRANGNKRMTPAEWRNFNRKR